MKKLIYAVCLAVYLPLIWMILLIRYGGMEGNCRAQETEKYNLKGGRDSLVEILQGEKMCFLPEEQDYAGIHSISFCREWKNDRDGVIPVTVVRIVRK